MPAVKIFDPFSAWYAPGLEGSVTPCKAGLSYCYHEEGNTRSVLCIHGYTGYPGEMVRPSRDLAAKGFDVYVPRLPGHGTSGADFLASNADAYLSVVSAALRDLKGRYDDVYVVGHSMGAAIALIVTLTDSVGRLVLSAPAIDLPFINESEMEECARTSARIPKPWKSDPRYIMYYEGAPADDAYLGSEYWSFCYPKQMLALAHIAHSGLASIAQNKADMLVITGGQDALVSPSVTQYFPPSGAGKRKFLHLERATHYQFYDIDKESEDKAVDGVLSFLL